MKENSIEEDIILLNDFAEGNFQRDKLEYYKGSYKMGYFYYKDIQQALDHLLSDYKRALKENEELKNQEATQRKINELLVQRYSNSIPVQKVKDLKNRILENEEYTVVLEGDKEFPDSTTEATFEKYINLKVLDELVERK